MNVRHFRGPYNRSIHTHNRAVRPVAILLALCCCLSAAHSQWLEKTLYLPDSFGGMTNPQCLAYDSANNTIYVGGEYGNCVLAIDGATNHRIARIPADSNGVALCYNPANRKVYCANAGSNNVTVIDGATNGVIATLATDTSPYALCYNLTNNKVYCANNTGNDVTVIDGATNGVITTVTAGTGPVPSATTRPTTRSTARTGIAAT